MTVVLPDFMPDIRYWLRNHPDLEPLHSQHVFFRLPNNVENLGAPVMALYRSGGGMTPDTDVPTITVRLGLEVWGFADSDYTAVRQLAIATESAFQQILGPTVLNPSGPTVALSGLVTAFPEAPDPETGWPRMVGDALLFIRGLPDT